MIKMKIPKPEKKKKKRLMPIILFFAVSCIGLVSGTTASFFRAEAFDLFYLFVEVVFGNILLSGLGLCAIILLIGMMSKMSPQLLSYLIVLFAVTFGAGYVGALVAVPIFLIAFYYFASSLLNFVNSHK